jgi:hypothetical protein
MDTFKLRRGLFLVALILIFLLHSCNQNSFNEENLIEEWNDAFNYFTATECSSNDLLKDSLEVKFRYNKGEIFNTLDDYIQFRLLFRDTIYDQLEKVMKGVNYKRIRVFELYNNYSSKAKITFELEDEVDQVPSSIFYKKNSNVYIESSQNLDDDFSTDRCIIAAKNSMITKMTIITDFYPNKNIITNFVSFY